MVDSPTPRGRGINRLALAVALASLLAIGVSACGGGSAHSSAGASSPVFGNLPRVPLKTGENPASQVLTGDTKKRGGTLTVFTSTDFSALDPGRSHLSLDYGIDVATQRPLFSYLPNTENGLSPDLATAIPTVDNGGVTDGGRTITVHIRKGVYFSPPVDREVTSADVAYAIERGANPHVANPYFATYFGARSPSPLAGSTSGIYAGGPLAGIQTPNKFTIVFHTLRASGSFLVSALSLPLSAPVPGSFARPLDRHSPSTYGTKYLVATGPYMIESNLRTGQVQGVGYEPGKSLTLVRNPNWIAHTDFRPAYLNRIDVKIGSSVRAIGQQVLNGSDAVQFDPPSRSTVNLAYDQYPSQVTFTSGAGEHYVALDTQHGLFTNLNLRRAAYANLDRATVVKLRGGSLFADTATHFVYPGLNGFEQSGGYPGPQTPWNQNVNGDLKVAERYMRAAGYKKGKYTGSATVQIVSDRSDNDPEIAQVTRSDLTQLGFHTRLTLVAQSATYARYCGAAGQQVDVCPTVERIRDFADPLTVLYRSFYGPASEAGTDENPGQLTEVQVNNAMRTAALTTNPTERAQLWANVDKNLVYLAVGIPEDFDNQPNIESNNVAGVNDQWNQGTWDLAFTSLRNP
jgi:peptide/nickel transport system substrate-binding protein